MSKRQKDPPKAATTDPTVDLQGSALQRLADALAGVLAIQSREPSAIFPDTDAGDAEGGEWAENIELKVSRLLYAVDDARKALLETGCDVPREWLMPEPRLDVGPAIGNRRFRGSRRWYVWWSGVSARDREALEQTWQEVRAAILRLQAHRGAGAVAPAAAASGAGDRVKKMAKADLRAWTQDDLDKAIREYKAQRAASYAGLRDGSKRNSPAAKKAAKEVYGRNAIARALGVKSRSMVSKSPAWIAIAQDLGLELHRGLVTGTRRTAKPGKIGLDMAVEQKSLV
jgi:hypothetical protein